MTTARKKQWKMSRSDYSFVRRRSSLKRKRKNLQKKQPRKSPTNCFKFTIQGTALVKRNNIHQQLYTNNNKWQMTACDGWMWDESTFSDLIEFLFYCVPSLFILHFTWKFKKFNYNLPFSCLILLLMRLFWDVAKLICSTQYSWTI